MTKLTREKAEHVTCPKTGFRCFLGSTCDRAGKCWLDPALKPQEEK